MRKVKQARRIHLRRVAAITAQANITSHRGSRSGLREADACSLHLALGPHPFKKQADFFALYV